MTPDIKDLPLFGGELPTVIITSQQEMSLHICRACGGTGWANIGTRRRPQMVRCMCAAGTREFIKDLENACPDAV
jgi:hypothetical protein